MENELGYRSFFWFTGVATTSITGSSFSFMKQRNLSIALSLILMNEY
jgi:hypothetical protein